EEFLHGRRRARARAEPAASPADQRDSWRLLGLPPGADAAEIKRAYRRLARAVHPDLHPEATADERRALALRFSAITAAYRALVA
ncbi:MAG: J domain-containing protein, partial [Polyangiaceae bacterium]